MAGYPMVFLYIIMPIEALLSAIPNVSSARVALERIQQFSVDLPVEDAGVAAPSNAFESIVLESVSHQYFPRKGK